MTEQNIGPELKSVSRGTIIYVPGLPGNTMDSFVKIASQWGLGGKKWNVVGVPHSSSKKTLPSDWVKDVKEPIMAGINNKLPLKIVGHSFGGLFALTALAELVEAKKITEDQCSQISFIVVGAPFYQEESLPDKRPLLGLDPKSFSFYEQIPMASKYAFKHIWQYLKTEDLLKVNSNETMFNKNLFALFEKLKNNAAILGQTNINIITLFPRQDRWISKQSGKDLQEAIGKPILIEEFDVPSASVQSMIGFNAHDEVNEWARAVEKYL